MQPLKNAGRGIQPCWGRGAFRRVCGIGLCVFLSVSGCESGEQSGTSDPAATAVSGPSQGFMQRLEQAKSVTRGELLRGLLVAATGSASATFSDNAEFAERSGLGTWKDPMTVVTVEEACRGTIACMNGVDAKVADPLGVVAAAKLLDPQRSASEPVSGKDFVIMLRGITTMTAQEQMFDLAATIPTGEGTLGPASSAGAKQTAVAPAKSGESFEDFGAPAAAAPAPAAKPASAPISVVPAVPAPTDVPSVRPEPLPTVPAPSAAPAAPKKNPWTPGTPVPQKPKDPPKEQPKDPKASPPTPAAAPKPKSD